MLAFCVKLRLFLHRISVRSAADWMQYLNKMFLGRFHPTKLSKTKD